MNRDTDEQRQTLVEHDIEYMMMGDLDKPFHRPECECMDCEQWRIDKNRPTHKELREKK